MTKFTKMTFMDTSFVDLNMGNWKLLGPALAGLGFGDWNLIDRIRGY